MLLLRTLTSGLSRIALIYVAVFISVSCASSGEKHDEQKAEMKQPVSRKMSPDAGATIESKQVAAQSNAPFVTEVKFARGSSALNSEMRRRIEKIFKQATEIGAPDEITVFAWADEEYPAETAPALPDSAQKIAQARARTVSDFLKHLSSKTSVKTIEMTSRPSGLGASLGLGDTRLKEMFEQAGIRQANADGSDGKPGTAANTAAPKASKAVAMITLKR